MACYRLLRGRGCWHDRPAALSAPPFADRPPLVDDAGVGPAGMTARLRQLRIAGFKSFADPVELDILPGLTGLVGPNGCGKSNVAEAIRWVMGEANARSLRGGEMADVIFAGTAARPSCHLAEVSITLCDEADGAIVSHGT